MGFSNYPTEIDNSTSIPIATDLVTPIIAESVNRIRDAVLAIQTELGTDPSRAFGTVKARLDDLNGLIATLDEELARAVIAPVSGNYNCPTTVLIRDMVYLTASDAIDGANASDASKRPAIGMVMSKPTPTTAIVQYYGEVGGFTGLTSGDSLFLAETDGQITSTAPSADGSMMQEIGVVKNATTIVLMISRKFIEL